MEVYGCICYAGLQVVVGDVAAEEGAAHSEDEEGVCEDVSFEEEIGGRASGGGVVI